MTITRKNQFEELIDNLIIDEVSGLDEEIRKTLEGLDVSKKRMAILSILDNDRDMFMKIKRMVDNNDVSAAEHIKHLTELMRAYVTVGEVEKKTLGEVMTPQSLVNQMVDTLPKDVWTNPELKWLDPCSGVGIFPAVIVERLMEGLKEWEPDQEKRYAHIVENMVHMGELQSKNLFLAIAAFDPRDEYELNVYNGSFLVDDFEKHARDVWGVEKFDVIIQNPPYQTNNPGEKKTHPIWDKFVKKALDITVDGGYNVNVHPDGWRAVGGRFKDTQISLRSNEILYLELHSVDEGVKTFGVQTTYDFYCVRKKENKGFKTKLKGQDKTEIEINLRGVDFIPNGMFEEIFNLVAKDGEEKVEVLYARSIYGTDKSNMSRDKSTEFRYPCVYTTLKDGTVNKFWSSVNDKGHFGIPKVIWSNGGATTPTVDLNGDFGLTQFSYAIIDDVENLENIKKAMESVKFNELMAMTDGLTCGMSGRAGSRYNRKAISTFRKDFWKEFI